MGFFFEKLTKVLIDFEHALKQVKAFTKPIYILNYDKIENSLNPPVLPQQYI